MADYKVKLRFTVGFVNSDGEESSNTYSVVRTINDSAESQFALVGKLVDSLQPYVKGQAPHATEVTVHVYGTFLNLETDEEKVVEMSLEVY